MAIPSILRLISYSFNTNILLVNFAIVKKKTTKRGRAQAPQPPSPPGSATANSRAASTVHASQNLGSTLFMNFFLSVCSQRRIFLLLRVRKMKTSSNNFFWKEILKWLKRFQVLLDPFVETSILFGILKYKHFKLINHIRAFFLYKNQ